jgi:Uma2 family endonuclease
MATPDMFALAPSAPAVNAKAGARVRTAVEVRSEHDYGPAAERAMRDKRADYFACGTLVVWDVDLQSEDVIKSYKASDPDNPVIFRRGDMAHAEPAVPGWQMPVDDLFA